MKIAMSLIVGTLIVGAIGCASQSNCPSSQSAMPDASMSSQTELSKEPAVETSEPALSSWQEGKAKATILDFVKRVSDASSADYVPPQERIAVFDNDGTLWVESPIYTQLSFALDRVRALSEKHPEWKKQQPFKAVIEQDMKTIGSFHTKELLQIMMASHAGTTSDEFKAVVSKWLDTAVHPTLGRPYTELVYKPMLELLTHLKSVGFKTYIVSGGGVDFIRVFAEKVYGIPPEQVIGSALAGGYEATGGKEPVVRRKAEVLFINDGPGKPESIDRIIGRRPILAFGNSDGDYEMLAWSTAGAGARLGALLHHTDEVREISYDRDSQVGKLARGLDDAASKGWLVVDMKADWLNVFSTNGSVSHSGSIEP